MSLRQKPNQNKANSQRRKKLAVNGKEILERKLNALKLDFSENNLKIILKHYHFKEHTEFFFQIAQGTVDLSKIKEINHKSGNYTLLFHN